MKAQTRVGTPHRLITALLLATVLGFSCGRSLSAQTTATEPTITVASFNLRVFGKTKASHRRVMAVLADIIERYDLVAVQEIRDKSGTAIQKLLTLIDSKNANYRMVVGPREGRTRSKEQYCFVYNSARLRLVGSPYVPDKAGANDLFEREPYLAEFRAVDGDLQFVIGDVHTKPQDATQEIADLPLVMADASRHFGETDVLMVGDFNADGSYFNENTYTTDFPPGKYLWLIGNSVDTNVARSSETYDRMVATESMGPDFEGQSGTLRFDKVFDLKAMGLTAVKVSDHWPIWAEFYADRDTD